MSDDMAYKVEYRSSPVPSLVQRRGTMLLLALFFIVVATSFAALIMASSSQLIRTTRHQHEALVLQQLTDSGRDWFTAHSGQNLDFPVTLSGAGIIPDGSSGVIRLRLEGDAPGLVVITAEVTFPRHKISRTTGFRLPS